jgi:tetratricopeptide (TPR) repeat protein
MYRAELAMRTNLRGDGDPAVARLLLQLALVLEESGDAAAAEELLRGAPAMQRPVVGNAHADIVAMLASRHDRRGEARRAMELFEKSLAIRRASPDSTPADVAKDLAWLARAQERAGEPALATATYRELAGMLRDVAPGELRLAECLATLGRLLLEQAEPVEAEPFLRESLEIRTARIPDDPLRHNAMSLLGGSLLEQGRHGEAEPLLVEAYEKMAPSFAADRRQQALARIVKLYEAWGRPEQAAPWKAKLAALTAEGKDR